MAVSQQIIAKLRQMSNEDLIEFYVDQFGENIAANASRTINEDFKIEDLIQYLEKTKDIHKSIKDALQYFVTERTVRISSSVDYAKHLDKNTDNGLKKSFISNNIGLGLLTTQIFWKDSFVCEYAGTLLTRENALAKEKEEGESGFMFYFSCWAPVKQHFAIDASLDNGRLGRYINHDKVGNVIPKAIVHNGTPKLFFIALKDIAIGEELRYNYGDERKNAVKANNWLRKRTAKQESTPLVNPNNLHTNFENNSLITSYFQQQLLQRTWSVHMYSTIGDRCFMEDVAQFKAYTINEKQYGLFAVYDGHGGSHAAEYSCNFLMDTVIENIKKQVPVLESIRDGFIQTHQNMANIADSWPLRENGEPSTAGTTVTLLIVVDDLYYVGNVGDSPLYVVDQGTILPKFESHKPSNDQEVKRIILDGGSVNWKAGDVRVNYTRTSIDGTILKIPRLNMSRALGNFWSKTSKGLYAVSPEPSVSSGNTNDITYFVITTDGVILLPFEIEMVLMSANFQKSQPAKLLVEKSLEQIAEVNENYKIVANDKPRDRKVRKLMADNATAIVLYPRKSNIKIKTANPKLLVDSTSQATYTLIGQNKKEVSGQHEPTVLAATDSSSLSPAETEIIDETVTTMTTNNSRKYSSEVVLSTSSIITEAITVPAPVIADPAASRAISLAANAAANSTAVSAPDSVCPAVALSVSTAGHAIPTASPGVSTAAPTVSTAPPAVSTAAPAVSTAAPAVSTAVPAASTAVPAVSIAAPDVSTAAPSVSTAAPAFSTAAPAVSAAAPAVSTAARAVSTAALSVSSAAPANLAPRIVGGIAGVRIQLQGIPAETPTSVHGSNLRDRCKGRFLPLRPGQMPVHYQPESYYQRHPLVNNNTESHNLRSGQQQKMNTSAEDDQQPGPSHSLKKDDEVTENKTNTKPSKTSKDPKSEDSDDSD